MAKEDEDFVEGDEATTGGDGKDAAKPKGRFASALLLQILKWTAIILGGILFMVTIAVIVNVALSGPGKSNQDRIALGPDYQAVQKTLVWFDKIGVIRGVTKDAERKSWVIQPVLGYDKEVADLDSELNTHLFPLKDELLAWFSEQSAEYLLNIDKRAEIKALVKDLINRSLDKPIDDLVFVDWQVVSF